MSQEESRKRFFELIDVSRETISKLDGYVGLLKKWNSTINLVSNASLDDLWNRHMLDSAQIFQLADIQVGHWVDIGTGGGFPGMVVAVIASERAPDLRFTFVESDLRKATFLRTVARETGANVIILSNRIESIQNLDADILSARALAPLVDLLNFAEMHLKPDGQALFPKGAKYRQEIEESLDSWRFQSQECRSITDDAAVILKLGEIRRVRSD